MDLRHLSQLFLSQPFCVSQLVVVCLILLSVRPFCLLDNPVQVKSEKLEKEAKSWELEICIYSSSAIMEVILYNNSTSQY